MAIRFQTDFSDIADLIGRAQAFSETVETPVYIDDVLRAGHGRAADQFDRDLAAAAVATNSFNHVYEWGTVGINPAPGTPPINPTSKRAKLWRHKMGGRNTSTKSIDFEFRASVVPVPLPTSRTKGVPRKYMEGDRAPKRRHIFYWRAPVMEFGMPVTIKPKYGNLLWIPLNKNIRTTTDPKAIRRGYLMTKGPIEMVPGITVAGNFSAYWVTWWQGSGTKIISEVAEHAVELDGAKVIGKAGLRTTRKYSGASKVKSFKLQVSNARAAAQSEMLSASKARKAQQVTPETEEVWKG